MTITITRPELYCKVISHNRSLVRVNCKLVSFSLDLRQKVAQIYVHLFRRRLYHIMLQIKVMFSALLWMPLRPFSATVET